MKYILLLLVVVSTRCIGQSQFELYARPAKTVSGNYTMLLFDVFLAVNTNSGSDTVTLPTAASAFSVPNSEGLIYHIKNVGNNSLYIKVASGDSLEGSPLLYLISPGNSSKEIQACNSKNFFIH